MATKAMATPFLLPLSPPPPAPSPHLRIPNTKFTRSPLVAPPSARFASAREALLVKSDLLDLISDQERGLRTEGNPSRRSEIVGAIDALAAHGKGTVTTGPELSGTWRMMWTTEKEQLFIIKNAGLFGTETGDVLQVIDTENGLLNNVITFPPSGVFFVRSMCEAVSSQRVNFRYKIFYSLSFVFIVHKISDLSICFGGDGRFTSAVLRGNNWEIPLPPFGRGW